ncbi:hypothetical protein JCM16163A_41080 [Paenibacillus sp. YK5]
MIRIVCGIAAAICIMVSAYSKRQGKEHDSIYYLILALIALNLA